MNHPARFANPLPDGRIECGLCPRRCRLRPGQRGFCFVRANKDGQLVLDTYGQCGGLAIDPMEKKPLYHFYPGQSVLSFGTPGCNLGCRFCQNWHLSKARDLSAAAVSASPQLVAQTARKARCRAVAFTYNDPIVFAEYAVDTALACREQGVEAVAVTAGYIEDAAREYFFSPMSAANIDLKSFNPSFYRRLTGGHLEVVLDTLRYVAQETRIWLEVTTLVIPGFNDSLEEVDLLCRWVGEELGYQVPLHFSAFHPDFRMREVARTPVSTLMRVRDQALDCGLLHVYIGNAPVAGGGVTYCSGCRGALIVREGFAVVDSGLSPGGRCRACAKPLAGRFD